MNEHTQACKIQDKYQEEVDSYEEKILCTSGKK